MKKAEDLSDIIEEMRRKMAQNIGADFSHSRDCSYDFCFNYFHKFEDKKCLADDMEKSCLALGFYLASWGMLRGSGLLLQRSAKIYEKIIEAIIYFPKDYWEIDVSESYEDKFNELNEIYKKIYEILRKSGGERNYDTIITKIMLGVFGNIPAFDSNFCCAFKLWRFDRKSIVAIGDFYAENIEIINQYSAEFRTIDFYTGENVWNYTKAKIIDMYGFEKGIELNKAKITNS